MFLSLSAQVCAAFTVIQNAKTRRLTWFSRSTGWRRVLTSLCLLQSVPSRRIPCRQSAPSGSFFARDNTANFLAWCRKVGVGETCLFESEDLGELSSLESQGTWILHRLRWFCRNKPTCLLLTFRILKCYKKNPEFWHSAGFWCWGLRFQSCPPNVDIVQVEFQTGCAPPPSSPVWGSGRSELPGSVDVCAGTGGGQFHLSWVKTHLKQRDRRKS